MNILLVHKNCLMGGVETLMAALAPIFQAQGHRCEFFFFQHGPMEEHLPEGSIAHFGDLADCLKLVKTGNFDIVHINSIDWTLGLSAVRGVGAKLVAMAQGRIVPGWTSANCDVFVACAEWHVEGQNRFTDLPIHVIFNGIDTELFKPNEEAVSASPPVVAWIGRGVDDAKQIEKLAEVAPLLHGSGIRIWLAEPHGPHEVEKVVPDITTKLLPFVERWELISRENMPQFFQDVAASGGCVLSTSKSEGLPMALIEAQGCGCPVIGTNVRGVNECVDPAHGGVLYPLEIEAEKLTSLICNLLKDKDGMHQRREACVRYIREQFDINKMAQKYLDVYREALSAKRNYSTGIRARFRLAPLFYWKDYVTHRWGPGFYQYETAQELANRGERQLAWVAARASLLMCPTLYARPERLISLLRFYLRSLL